MEIKKFLRGELSVAVSFWGYFIGLNVVAFLIFGFFGSVFNWRPLFLFCGTAFFLIPIQILTLQGVWRSSSKSKWSIILKWLLVILVSYNFINNFFTFIVVSNVESTKKVKEKSNFIKLDKAVLKCQNSKETLYVKYDLTIMEATVSKQPFNNSNTDFVVYELNQQASDKDVYFFKRSDNLVIYFLDLNERLELRDTRSVSSYNCVYLKL